VECGTSRYNWQRHVNGINTKQNGGGFSTGYSKMQKRRRPWLEYVGRLTKYGRKILGLGGLTEKQLVGQGGDGRSTDLQGGLTPSGSSESDDIRDGGECEIGRTWVLIIKWPTKGGH